MQHDPDERNPDGASAPHPRDRYGEQRAGRDGAGLRFPREPEPRTADADEDGHDGAPGAGERRARAERRDDPLR